MADGWYYPVWVVGAARMRAVSADWPAVGAELHHSVGGWPFLLDDIRRATKSVPGRELVLRGRGWPASEVEVQVVLEPTADGGREIVMREDAVAGPARLTPYPLRAPLIFQRNTESVRRLAYLAERPAP
nr:SRPBCC family protein [Pseudonocardia nigra]